MFEALWKPPLASNDTFQSLNRQVSILLPKLPRLAKPAGDQHIRCAGEVLLEQFHANAPSKKRLAPKATEDGQKPVGHGRHLGSS